MKLVLNPTDEFPESIQFSVSEGDIDDAIDMGRAERNDPIAKQIRDTAYHMILELKVDRRILTDRWALFDNDGQCCGTNCLK